MTIAKADLIEGMAKGMAVLESFDTERQRLNATLAAQRAGITRASARRHLLTLTHPCAGGHACFEDSTCNNRQKSNQDHCLHP